MNDLTVPPFMHGANVYLKGGEVNLDQLVAEFRSLQGEDQRLYFGQLCRRKYEVSDQLINLLFEIGAILPRKRPATFGHLWEDWQKRGKGTLSAEKMYTIICEQFAP